MVIDRKNILLADESLDITNDIMKLLNKKLNDVKMNTIEARPQNLAKPPNCLLNDYTKNIS